MILMKTIPVFLHKKQCYEVDAVQGENGRGLVLRLFEEAGEWMPPARTKVHIRFRKCDGTGGVYDTLPNGLSAWRIERNRVYVEMAPQVLALPGLVQMQVVLVQGNEELSTFTIHIHVEADPSLDTLGSVEYFNLSTRINDEVNAKLTHMEQSWQRLFNEITITMYSKGGFSSSGAEVSSDTDIRSDMIVLGGRNMSVTFPEGLLVRCYYYNAQEKFLGCSDTYGEPFTEFHTADYVRLGVCYEDERIITDLYALSDSISISFPSDRIDAYRGNIRSLGFRAFSDCVEDGYYAFEREDLAHISDAPALGCGGVLVVYAHGPDRKPIKEILTSDGQRWYWSNGGFRKSEDYLILGKNLCQGAVVTEGYFISPSSGNPAIAPNCCYATVAIPAVTELTVGFGCYIYAFEASNTGGVSFWDKNMNNLGVLDVKDYKIAYTHNGFPCATLPVPEGAAYVRYTVRMWNSNTGAEKWNANQTMLVAPGKADDVMCPRIARIDGYPVCIIEQEPASKKWAVIGDSISAVNTTAMVKYHDYVAQELGLLVSNHARSGAGFTSGTTFSTQIAELAQEDCDVITIFTSGNDCDNDPPLGQVTDTGADTLCGVINSTLDELFALKPYTSVGIITSCPWKWFMPSTPKNLMENYNNAIIEIARRRGIPVLDLYHCSNMRPDDEGFRTKFYNENGVQDNGVHPNSEGHKILAAPIREFVRGLIRP